MRAYETIVNNEDGTIQIYVVVAESVTEAMKKASTAVKAEYIGENWRITSIKELTGEVVK